MLKRPVMSLLLAALAMPVLASCVGGRGEPEAPRLGVVSVGPRQLTITQPPGHICVRAVRTPGTAAVAPTCLPADFGFTGAVVSAALDPLDAGADLVAVLTQPDVAIDGLSVEVARLLVRSEGGNAVLALWVDAPPAGSAIVCTTYTAPARDAGDLVVHRSAAVGHATAVEVGDDCR